MSSRKVQTQTITIMTKSINLYIITLIIGFSAIAQVPTPAPSQSEPIAIVNGTAHIGNGEVLEDAVILFDNGKITSVTNEGTVDLSGYRKLDATGKHIYPGLISPVISLGLVEVEAVRATLDEREVGDFNPHVRSIVAYNTDSEAIPTMKFTGIQIAQVTSKGGRIPGTSSIVQLDAWNWEDAIYKKNDGVHVNWPALSFAPRWWKGETERRENENYQQQVNELIQFIEDAKSYHELGTESENLKLESMKAVFTGDKRLFLAANRTEQIIEAIQSLKKLGISNIILVGGADAWYVKDLLKENDIPVLLTDVHRTPNRTEDEIDLPYRLPAILHNEGILVGLTYGDVRSARNLPFYAGTAAAYGVNKEEALAMITANTAKILGIADKTGTLEVGKDANIVISTGDLLDMRTNNIEHSFIQGREVDLVALQQRLYQKYKARYENQN